MSFVIASPEALLAAATDLAAIRSTIRAANAAAAVPTTGALAPAADEVSAGIAALFGAQAQSYQAVSAQAAAFHDRFVQLLNAGGGSYASAEIANAQQNLLNAVNAPTQTLLGRPLVGDGADGASGPVGQPGGDGGILWGNGGNGGDSTSPGVAGGAAIAAIAVQDPPSPAGLPSPRRPIGTVADQGAPQQRLGGRVDRGQQLLLDLGLGGRICSSATGKRLHELLMKRRRLGTSASNPPARQPRIQRSMVWRLMRTRRPNGSVCSREANSRTIFPRCLVECAASAASQINW